MLQTITDVLISIGDFLSSVVNFIVDFLADLVSFVSQLLNIGTIFTDMFSGAFPSYFVGGLLSLIVIMVLLRVLGRD